METVLATQENAQRLANVHEEKLKDLIDHSIELRSMKPGALRTSMAVEYAREARGYLEDLEMSELRTQTKNAYDTHRFLSRILQKLKKPAEILKKQCDDIRVDWEVERRRNIEDDRRKREAQATLFAQEQRQAEVDHLKEIGQAAQAEKLATAPLPSVSVSIDTDAGKPTGEIMVEVWRPKRDENDAIVFSDLCSYLAWLVGNPPLYHFLKHEYGKIKKWLTDNRGLIQPPGLEIEHTFEPRTRMEADD